MCVRCVVVFAAFYLIWHVSEAAHTAWMQGQALLQRLSEPYGIPAVIVDCGVPRIGIGGLLGSFCYGVEQAAPLGVDGWVVYPHGCGKGC